MQHRAVKCVGGEFKIVEEPIPSPGPGDVLIRMKYSTVNPYDREHAFPMKQEGALLGSDGSGIIEKVGEGVDPGLVGKKVTAPLSSWHTYDLKNLERDYVIVHDDKVDLKLASMGGSNPWTALCMRKYLKEHKAIIQNAAGSHISKIFSRHCFSIGIPVINIVRRPEAKKSLVEELKGGT